MMPASRAERILESHNIIVPPLAFGVIGFADLPVAGRIVEPPFEARQLLRFADVQEEF
jgi:hypothetical protein